VAQASRYPFLNALTPVLEKLKDLTRKPYTWYLTELPRQEIALLDMKVGVIDPVRKFMSGPQKGIFDNASNFVQTQEPNFAYISEEVGSGKWQFREDSKEVSPADLVQVLKDPECYKGNRMQQVKTQVETLQKKVNARLEAEIAKAGETIAALKERLCGMAEFGTLNSEQQEQITRPFNEFTATIESRKLIAVIRDTLRRFEEDDYPQLLAQLSGQWPVVSDQQEKQTKSDDVAKTIRYPLVTIHSLKVPFSAAWLTDENDVDRYLESMREALLEEIRKGKRIQI